MTKKVEKYVLGQDKLPDWLWNKVMMFRSGGEFKYEFYGKYHDVYASKGDVVVVEGRKWWITKNT